MSEHAQAWPLVVDFMRRRCGLVLRGDQEYLMASRLTPVARLLGYPSLLRFVADATSANGNAKAVLHLVDAMTTHETSFFRDPVFWDTFVRDVLPVVVRAARTPQGATVWSAACSTGQEPYTVAMLLEELVPSLAANVRILATDVSSLAVDKAKTGVYSVLESGRGLHARRLVQHFEQDRAGFRVKAKLAERVRWSTYNLLGGAPPPQRCDVVLCRNVLIYFDERDRQAVITRLFDAAAPGGFVGVGATELLPGKPVSPGWYPVRKGSAMQVREMNHGHE
jgi:chemotaxis protein methyltransferase CheR